MSKSKQKIAKVKQNGGDQPKKDAPLLIVDRETGYSHLGDLWIKFPKSFTYTMYAKSNAILAKDAEREDPNDELLDLLAIWRAAWVCIEKSNMDDDPADKGVDVMFWVRRAFMEWSTDFLTLRGSPGKPTKEGDTD